MKLSIRDLDLKGKRCLVRVDFNVPLDDKDGVMVMQSPDMWFMRDTDGDGKADWKERIVHGLDAADSHHETNSICYEPGGAVYFSDGVFHRSNVETLTGPGEVPDSLFSIAWDAAGTCTYVLSYASSRSAVRTP